MNRHNCGLLTMESVEIPLQGVEVSGVITGRSARVRVRQHFRNCESGAVEAIYKFPLPENSAVCGFKATTGEKTWEGQIEEKDKAFKLYDRALEAGDGAYLLDEERPNIFTLSLGNLNPGTSAVIEIDYVTMLDAHGGQVRFFLPTTISPRYVPDGMEEDGIPVEDIVNPVFAVAVPYGISIKLDIHGREGISAISSPSHSIVSGFSEDLITVEFSAQTVAMDRDFLLDVTYKDKFRDRAFVCSDGDAKYMQLDLSPSLKASRRKDGRNTEIVFVLDCSGSMSGSSIAEARQALNVFLKGMTGSTQFNIYRFGSRFEKLFEASKPYTEEHLNRAVNYLSGVDADLGGTELLAPLEDIYRAKRARHSRRSIVLITDGQIGDEQAVSSLVQGNAGTTTLFVVGIGYGPNEYLVKQLARSSGGAAECIAPGDRIEPIVLRLFKKAMVGEISNLTIDWGSAVDQSPLKPVLFNEASLSLFARMDEDVKKPDRVVVTGEYLGSKREWKVDVQSVTGVGIPVPLLWARERIRDLEEGTVNDGGSKQVERKGSHTAEEIIALSRKYGIVSRDTSFIVVEKRPKSKRTKGETVLRKVPVMLTRDWHGAIIQSMGPAVRMFQRSDVRGVRRLPIVSDAIRCAPVGEHYPGHPSCKMMDSGDSHSDDRLFRILALQRAEGGFEFNRGATGLIGLSYDDLRECAARMVEKDRSDRQVLLSTAIVLRILEMEFADARATWYDLTQKSRDWYEAEVRRVEPSVDGMSLSDWAEDCISKRERWSRPV